MNIKLKKTLKTTAYVVVILFALIGFGLTSAFFAIKLHLTNDPGTVDVNDRYFQDMSKKEVYLGNVTTKAENAKQFALQFYKTGVLSRFYPLNAELIIKAANLHQNWKITEKMLDAVNQYMTNNQDYMRRIDEGTRIILAKTDSISKQNIFEWMNISEWSDFKWAVVKDTTIIDSVARVTGVESRLIVSVLVGEQIRLFNSKREMYKKVIGPLKILSTETQFSLGVTGIKEETARWIEKYLKDSSSVYYIGKKYETLLNFKTADIENERFKRLTDYHNHYYSYLYAAIFMKQVRSQWKKAGFDISNRQEILATLFNVGFIASQPKANPSVGGSHININDKLYTFGRLAYEFYYSGELAEVFPFHESFFKD
ncbi:MAG: hypothetical protein WCH34_16345 [Bacteroidota bacterium]